MRHIAIAPFLLQSLEERMLFTVSPLDPNFGSGGRVTTPLGFERDSLSAVAVQNNGQTVVVGTRVSSDDNRSFAFTVTRYNTDGSIDTHFGDGGIAEIAVTTEEEDEDASTTGIAVALQSNGKIVVGGSAQFSLDGVLQSPQSVLARLNNDGTPDDSFGTDGQLDPFTGTVGSVQSLAIEGTQIVAAGVADNQFSVFRCDAGGTPDAHFGDNGVVNTMFGAGASAASAVAIQSDNKIIAVGHAGNSLAIARYKANGALDTTFGVGGKVTDSLGAGATTANAVSIDGNGKILIGGSVGGRFLVARYRANGTLDGTFATHGKNVSAFTGAGTASAVIALGGGKILAGGTAGGKFALAQLTSGGKLDASFSNYGTQQTAFAAAAAASGMAIGTGNTIVLSGTRTGGRRSDFAIARYLSDGALDATFHHNGKLIQNFGGTARSESVAVQKDGKLLLAGTVGDGGTSDVAVVRYNTDGTIDTGFGANGKATAGFGVLDATQIQMLVEANGDVLVGTWLSRKQAIHVPLLNRLALARFLPDGKLDTSFGQGGRLVVNDDVAFNGMAVDAAGKIVAAGESFGDTGSAVFRFNANGTPDDSFGSHGVVATQAGFTPADVAITHSGKIIVDGTGASPNNAFLIVRYNHDGSIDPAFHFANTLSADRKFNKDFTARNLVLTPAGKILVGGVKISTQLSVLAQYNADGSVDSAFATSGKFVTGFDNLNGLAIGPGSTILASGTGTKLLVLRLTAAGVKDATFGSAGEAMSGLSDSPYDLAVQTDGNVVVSVDTDGSSFGIVRFLG